MFSYPYQKDQLITPTKAMFLGLLCAVWLLTGLIGHDPWKPDEAYSFGLVYHILKGGDWLVPALAGEPFLEKPPLFYWTAAISAKVFAPFLPLHDGARLASGFYMMLTLLFTGSAGRELFGKSAGWAAAIILIGNLGLLIHAHLLVTDLALLTGCAMMIYGYALSERRHRLAGFILGTGVGIGFMAKGFIAPVFFLFISLILLFFSIWRTRSFLITLGIALLSVLPWLAVWPTLLYLYSPELFAEWAWQLNIGRWVAHARGGDYPDPFFYVTLLPWFAWPAFPLAIWAVWEARRKLRQAFEFQLLTVTFAVMLLALSLAPRINELCALPMLLPLTLLATAALFTLRRGAANALDWFGIMTFALVAILLWWGWTGLLVDSPAHITRLLKEYRPGFEPIFQRNQFWIAVVVSVLWIVLVWRIGRSIRRSVINWAAGVTLLWILAVTLWMPWLDSSKSYRVMVGSLKKALPASYNCVSGVHVAEGQRAMLDYFGNIAVRAQPRPECDLMLVEGSAMTHNTEDATRWTQIWEGGRPGDKGEHYWLYRRKGVKAH
ncbi:MAG: glycosyltransferase family 39 protein [Gallionellaceae bacterium]|nr:MAG: glycosyltransferase family 39 protein [Gallionellaceae bacterium]